jgi:hypothetical protein
MVDQVLYFTYVKGNVRVRYSPLYRSGMFRVLAGPLWNNGTGYLVVSVSSLQAIIDCMVKHFN